MTDLTACPTLPMILAALGSEGGNDQVEELVRHLVACPACVDTLARLNIAESVLERLRAAHALGGPQDRVRIDSLILSLRTAANPGLATSRTDQTVDSSSGQQAVDDEEWATLLTSPQGPGELGRLGSYRILRVLGSGGMGAVFEAEDPDLSRRVALKVPHRSIMKSPAARERFLREARAAATLRDEHIVTIYQVGQVNDHPFLAMELLVGEPLDARLTRDGRLSATDVIHIGREVAEGLAAAHDQGLIHRDIKPANIWLNTRPVGRESSQSWRSERVKLLDFGLARPSSADTQLTATGQIMGTPHYMAPEQARGDDVDPRADLFSLGCVMYEMASGAQAFSGNSVMTVLTALATYTPPPLTEVRPDAPPALAELIGRLLNKNPADRPATAWEVVDALRTLEGHPPIGQPIAVETPSAPPIAVGRRRVLLGGAAAFGAGALGLGWALTPWNPWKRAADPDGNVIPIANGEPIRVGILHSLTGTMALSERPVIDATLLAIEEINAAGGLLGSRVEAIVEDGQSDGAVFTNKSKKLVTGAKVAAVFGCWTSASRKAVRPVFEKHDHLLLYPVQYEGMEQSPNIFYLGAAPNQQIIPAVTWCCAFLKKKRLFLVGSDYVFPRAANAIIRDQAASLGAEIVGEEYLLLGSSDVKSVVEKIAASSAEVILNTINGDSNVAFFRALRAVGITPDKVPTISFSIPEEELSSFSPKDVAGDYAAWNYFQSIDSSQNHAFVSRFRQRFGPTRVVSDPMEAAYVGVHLWAQAVQQAGSADPKAVRAALKTQSYDAPEGMLRIDGDTQHAEKIVRIGQITPEGRFAVVYSSEQAIPPIPYPATRPKLQWDAFLNDLHLRWGGNWANPGR